MSSYPTNLTDNHGQVIEKFLDVQEQVSSQEHCERNRVPFVNEESMKDVFKGLNSLQHRLLPFPPNGRIRVHEGTTHSKYLEKILSL
ncbi:MAG: hypothetical protein J6Y37_05325 [Paludibacteraceae bacterium]|nr:hypothetical protein [Paludibacteraceae bacterium]